MKLKKIVVSGANETTAISALFTLAAEVPQLEFGIQVSGRKCGEGSLRLQWLDRVYRTSLVRGVRLPVALHLNQDWVQRFIGGEVPPEVAYLLSLTVKGLPLFERVQLNFKIGREPTPSVEVLEDMMRKYPYMRFILSHNDANAALIREVYERQRVMFDVLYDNSFGEGVVAEHYEPPVFSDIFQGYAGGLSAENVAKELADIAKVVPEEMEIFIDAEGKLKENGIFSIQKARAFISNALKALKA